LIGERLQLDGFFSHGGYGGGKILQKLPVVVRVELQQIQLMIGGFLNDGGPEAGEGVREGNKRERTEAVVRSGKQRHVALRRRTHLARRAQADDDRQNGRANSSIAVIHQTTPKSTFHCGFRIADCGIGIGQKYGLMLNRTTLQQVRIDVGRDQSAIRNPQSAIRN